MDQNETPNVLRIRLLPQELTPAQATANLDQARMLYHRISWFPDEPRLMTLRYAAEVQSKDEAISEAARYVQAMLTGGLERNSHAVGALIESRERAHVEQVRVDAERTLIFCQVFTFRDLNGDAYLCALSMHSNVPEDDVQAVTQLVAKFATKFQR